MNITNKSKLSDSDALNRVAEVVSYRESDIEKLTGKQGLPIESKCVIHRFYDCCVRVKVTLSHNASYQIFDTEEELRRTIQTVVDA